MSSPPRQPHLRRVPDAPPLTAHTPRRQSPNTSLTSIGSASSQLPPLAGIGLTPWARRSDPARLITTPGLMAMGGLIASPSFTPDMQISASAPGFGPSPIRSPSARRASSGSQSQHQSQHHSSPPSATGLLLHRDDDRRPRAPSRAGSDSALLPTPQARESGLPTPREMAARMPDSPRGDTSNRLPGLGHLLKPAQSAAGAVPQAQVQAPVQARPQVVPYAPRPLRRGPEDSQCTDADAEGDAEASADADTSGEQDDRSADQSQADLVGLGVVLDAHQRRHRPHHPRQQHQHQPPRSSSPLRRTLPPAPRLGSSDQGRFSNVLDIYPNDERVLLPRPVPHSAPPQIQAQAHLQPQPSAQLQAQAQAQSQMQQQLQSQAHQAAPQAQGQVPSWGPSPKRMVDPAAYPRVGGLSGLGLTLDEHDLSWRPVEQDWARWPQGEMTPHLFADLPLEAAPSAATAPGVQGTMVPGSAFDHRMHMNMHLHSGMNVNALPNPSPMSNSHLSLPSPTGTMLDSPAVGWSALPDEKSVVAVSGAGAAVPGAGAVPNAFAAAKQAACAPTALTAAPTPKGSKKPVAGSYRVQSKARSAALVRTTAAAFEAHAAAAPKGGRAVGPSGGNGGSRKRKQPLVGAEEEQSPWGVFSLNPKKSGWKPLFPPGIRPPVLLSAAQVPMSTGTGTGTGTGEPTPPTKTRVLAPGATATSKLALKPKPALALKVNRV